MLNLALLVLFLIASILLAAIILMLGLWMRGIDSIALPGLGLIIATPLLLIGLLIAEAVVVTVAAYLIRYVPLAQLLSWVNSLS